MVGLPTLFHSSGGGTDYYPPASFWGSFGASHCFTQASPQGPIGAMPEAMMTWSTAVWSWRHCVQSTTGRRSCLQHLQEGLGILHGAHAVEDHGTCIATTNRQGSISFTSSTSRTCPLPSNVVPA